MFFDRYFLGLDLKLKYDLEASFKTFKKPFFHLSRKMPIQIFVETGPQLKFGEISLWVELKDMKVGP